jgi:hypothetical protein
MPAATISQKYKVQPKWSLIVVVVWIALGVAVELLDIFQVINNRNGVLIALGGVAAFIIDQIIRDINYRRKADDVLEGLTRTALEIKEIARRGEVGLSVNAVRPDIWLAFRGEFHIYNAMWVTPSEVLSTSFPPLLAEGAVRWHVVFFEGTSEDERATARVRYTRMRRTLKGLAQVMPDLEQRVLIKFCSGLAVPGTIFYTGAVDGVRKALLFADALITEDQPRFVFSINDKEAISALDMAFDRAWGRGRAIAPATILMFETIDDLIANLSKARSDNVDLVK